MCEKVALPNMALRCKYLVDVDKGCFWMKQDINDYDAANDEELFEDDPIEYIRRDLEGSGLYSLFQRCGDYFSISNIYIILQIPTRVDELRPISFED